MNFSRSTSTQPTQPKSRDFREELARQERERSRLREQTRSKTSEQSIYNAPRPDYTTRNEGDVQSRWREYEDMKYELLDRWSQPEKTVEHPSDVNSAARSSKASAMRRGSLTGIQTTHLPPSSYHRGSNSSIPSLSSSSSPSSSFPSTPISSARASPVPSSSHPISSTHPRTLHTAASSSHFRPTIPTPTMGAHHRSRSYTNLPAPLFHVQQRATASDSDVPIRPQPLDDEERRRREAEHARRKAQATAYVEQRLREESSWRAAHTHHEVPLQSGSTRPEKSSKYRTSAQQTTSGYDTRRSEQTWVRPEQPDRGQMYMKPSQKSTIPQAWDSYESRWEALQGTKNTPSGSLTFTDIPWPVAGVPSSPSSLTSDSIEKFLLSTAHSQNKGAKQRLREAMLRFHPDRFEGRWMDLIRPSDRPAVKEAVGLVVRYLNDASARFQ